MILQFARLSILVNGSPRGYFECGRGVRQGDPLSPLLFCITEDILSRGILNLRQQRQLNFISSPRGVTLPSHVFYVDDVIVLCSAHMRGAEHLMQLREDYEDVSGRW